MSVIDFSATSSPQVKDISTYALIVSDMAVVTENGGEIMTKHAKKPSDISYTVNDDESVVSSGSDDDRTKMAMRPSPARLPSRRIM